jgi:DNA polymerase-3 subunit alpha
VGGIVSAVKQLTTKRGEPMVFLALDDPTGGRRGRRLQLDLRTARELCVADRILVIKGRIDHKQQGETKLIAHGGLAFEAVQERTEIRFKLDARSARAGLIKDLAHLVKDYPGPSMVFVSLETSLGPKTLALGPDYRVAIDTDFLTEARTLLGADAIL